MKPKFLIIVSLAGLLLAGPCYGERRRSAAHQPPTQDQPDTQPAPTPPPTLAELPATPPQVSFQGGQLTISAQNSTLGDILKAVRAQTGATIDLPGTAPERVVGHFGPAPRSGRTNRAAERITFQLLSARLADRPRRLGSCDSDGQIRRRSRQQSAATERTGERLQPGCL